MEKIYPIAILKPDRRLPFQARSLFIPLIAIAAEKVGKKKGTPLGSA